MIAPSPIQPRRVIALVEPYWTGHPETQLRQFVEILARRAGLRVIVLCQRPESMRAWIEQRMPDCRDRFFAGQFGFAGKRGDHRNRSLASWALAHRALLDAENQLGWAVDLVFVTWLDPFMRGEGRECANAMPRDWVGLFLFPDYLRSHSLWSWRSRRERFATCRSFFAASRCRGVCLLDEGIQKTLSRLISPVPVRALPDVADHSIADPPTPLARAVIDRAAGRHVIGLLGVLGRRKGTMTFLRAIQASDPSRCFFVLAGQLGPEERKTYAEQIDTLDALLGDCSTRRNAFLHLESIATEQHFNSLLAACDTIYLAYEGHHHSSGILSKAAFFKRLVIAPRAGCVAERVERFRLGVRIRAGSVRQAAAAIRAVSHAETRSMLLAKARHEDYCAHHGRDALAAALLAALDPAT